MPQWLKVLIGRLSPPGPAFVYLPTVRQTLARPAPVERPRPGRRACASS